MVGASLGDPAKETKPQQNIFTSSVFSSRHILSSLVGIIN